MRLSLNGLILYYAFNIKREMRRNTFIVLALLMLVSPTMTLAQGYICSDQGTQLHYIRRYAGNGKVKWRHTMTIDRVTMLPDGARRIEYDSDFKKANGRQMYGGPVSLTSDILSDGTVRMNVSQTMFSLLRNIFPKTEITNSECVTSLPSVMRAGDILPDVVSAVAARGVEYRMAVTGRKVTGTDTVTTPAGIFPCVVVSEHKVEKTIGYSRETTAHTWYCEGVGMVRHDTYDKNMILETSEVLEKISKQ